MDLQEAQRRVVALRALYARYEEKLYGRAWSVEEIMLGFVGDVGDLAKLVQGAAGVRHTPELEEKLAHELADCLWSVLVLADRLEIDLTSAFADTIYDLEGNLRARLAE